MIKQESCPECGGRVVWKPWNIAAERDSFRNEIRMKVCKECGLVVGEEWRYVYNDGR